jgi:DnaJ-class molecular chaperone
MEKKIPKKIKPEVYAQICPNCNGRGTVGYDAHPCPTCGKTNTPGIVFVPIRMNGGKNERVDKTT